MRSWLLGLVVCCGPEAARHDLPVVHPAARTPKVVVQPRPTLGHVLVWRVMEHVYVENDSGVPTEMRTVVRLEVGDTTLGPFQFGSPGCTLGAGTQDPTVISGLSCYYAGAGEYVEVREKSPGQYEVTSYGQGESYPDEPEPPKEALRTLGTFYAERPPLEEHLVALDGGTYEPYR